MTKLEFFKLMEKMGITPEAETAVTEEKTEKRKAKKREEENRRRKIVFLLFGKGGSDKGRIELLFQQACGGKV